LSSGSGIDAGTDICAATDTNTGTGSDTNTDTVATSKADLVHDKVSSSTNTSTDTGTAKEGGIAELVAPPQMSIWNMNTKVNLNMVLSGLIGKSWLVSLGKSLSWTI
jgi:hypothetical protein